MERVETVLNVLTFYGPDTKVQDWSRITYYKKEQTVVGSNGTTFSFDVLVQARVEVLMGSDPDLGLTGDVIENNAFFLRWGETAWIWDHYSGQEKKEFRRLIQIAPVLSRRHPSC